MVDTPVAVSEVKTFNPEKVLQRYDDGYRTGRLVNRIGQFVKVIGAIIGILAFVGSAMASQGMRRYGLAGGMNRDTAQAIVIGMSAITGF